MINYGKWRELENSWRCIWNDTFSQLINILEEVIAIKTGTEEAFEVVAHYNRATDSDVFVVWYNSGRQKWNTNFHK